MKNYYRIMPGKKSMYANECLKGNFIGMDFGINLNLSTQNSSNWKTFNRECSAIYLKHNPEKNKISAGLASSALWTIAKEIQNGDIVLCPDGSGNYLIGEVIGQYSYHSGQILPHRREIRWYSQKIARNEMSQNLQNSTGSSTVITITNFANEINKLVSAKSLNLIISPDKNIEDISIFALEKHLEDFLVANWAQTELGKNYDIYNDDEGSGQQYRSDTGPIDILAISKDKKSLLVVELKKGRTSDAVVGQILRYMSYVKEELAEKNQTVKGVIIATEDDQRIKRALTMTKDVEFYKYQISFKLLKTY